MRVLVTPLDPEQPVPATPARALGPREPQTAARRHLSRNAPWLSSPGACKASLKLRPPGAAELLRIPRPPPGPRLASKPAPRAPPRPCVADFSAQRRGLSAGPLAPNAPPKLLPPRLGLAHVARGLSAGPLAPNAPPKLLHPASASRGARPASKPAPRAPPRPRVADFSAQRRGLSAGPLAPNAPPKLLPPRLGLAHVAGSLRVPLRRTPRPSSSTPPRPRARRELSAGPRERSAPRKLLPPRLGLARVAGSLRVPLRRTPRPSSSRPASASRTSRAGSLRVPLRRTPRPSSSTPPRPRARRGLSAGPLAPNAPPKLLHPASASRAPREATAVEHQRQRPEQMNSSPRPTGAATEATDVPRKRWRHRCAAGRCAALMSCEPGLMPPKHVRPLSFPKAPTPLGRPIISCSAALRDAARLAVEAALDVRGIAFERAGVALRPHNGFARPRSGPPRSGPPAAPPRPPLPAPPAPPLPAPPGPAPPALTRAQGPASCRRTSCGRASGRASCSSPAISSPRWRRRSVRAQGQGEDEVAACEHNDAPLEGYDAEGGFSRKLNTGLVVELVLVDKSDTAKPAFANFNAQQRACAQWPCFDDARAPSVAGDPVLGWRERILESLGSAATLESIGQHAAGRGAATQSSAARGCAGKRCTCTQAAAI
eukprot:tig00020553_g10510.t1